MWTAHHELFRSQLSREDVPSVSGEATTCALSGPEALSNLLISFALQIRLSIFPLGTILGKSQSLSPSYIWDVGYLEVRATSRSLQGPLEKYFHFCGCSLENLPASVFLAANSSVISFFFWVYIFISTFTSLYFTLTKWPLFSSFI